METRPSSSSSFSPATNLNLDRLKVLKLLGKGATGTVFLVHDSVSDSSVSSPFALKLVDKSSASSLRRARWEIQILRRLSDDTNPNPFLPKLLASSESSEFIAWALPYCSGGDLNVLRQLLRPPFIPLRDDGDLTGKVTEESGFGIKEYFEKLKPPPLPLPHECSENNPFVDF
ncbi:unnamed protein product [Arabidopsis thaliana]|uniref:non-specific serine/threonine protein kinase n=1 Tax=Arabidopsis thaliana TaxID=3702 RepID=A0A7G2E051_ARATH|nr:unnamed protein product [Arabidopsis thaliana]